MPRFKITKPYVDALLRGFRERPGVGAHAARLAGCTPSTARRAWLCGIQHSPWPEYRRPFRELIEEEQAEARAELRRLKELEEQHVARAEADRRQEARVRALEDLSEERVAETQLVRTARAGTLALLNSVTKMGVGAAALGDQVREALQRCAQDPEPLSLKEAVDVTRLVGRLSTALRQCNDAGQRAMEMTRLLVGEPQAIYGHQHLEAVGVQEAGERLAAAQRALEDLGARGLSVVDGNTQAVRSEAEEGDGGAVH